MSSKDYGEIEKTICGKWKGDRDENMDAWVAASEMSDAGKFAFQQQDTQLHITRDGNSIREKTIGAGMEFESIFILNEILDFKDNPDNPTIHVKTTPSWKDGAWCHDTHPQTKASGRRYFSRKYRSGDELVTEKNINHRPLKESLSSQIRQRLMQNGSTKSVEALNRRMGEEMKTIITVKTDSSERNKQGEIDLPIVIRIG